MTDSLTLLSQFHFLRPLWLLALLLLPALWWLAHRSASHNSSWAQAINPQLLHYLLDESSERSSKWPLYSFLTCLILAIVALAGPVWKKIPQPLYQPNDALVIVLDQSLSMQATDIKPSRQIATQHKLTDLLKARQQGQTALLVYAGDTHIVSPLTDDTDTIIAMLPALSPLIMPALGSRVSPAIARASQLLKDGGISEGRILLITDGIQKQDIKAVSKQLANSDHQLSILLIGTAEGAPIPLPGQGFLRHNNDIVIAKTTPRYVQQLAQQTAAVLTSLTLDDSDINKLLPPQQAGLSQDTREVERDLDQWREEGSWLILLILPFAALAFRRGWLLTVFLMVLVQPAPVQAMSWSALWQTADQQGAKAFSTQDFQAASKHFESPEWQGSSAYRAGDYEAAAEYFSRADTATAHYNRGNALARIGKFDQAIAAYDEALARDPQLADAKTNKALVEQLRQPPAEDKQGEPNNSEDKQGQSNKGEENQGEQQQGQQQNQPSANSEQQQDNKQQGEQPQNAAGENSASSAGQQAQDQPAQQQQQENAGSADANGQPPAQPAAEPVEQSAAEQQALQDKAVEPSKGAESAEAEPIFSPLDKLSEEQQQAMDQWLRRIPDDPGGLLKRKFNYQYQQNQRSNQFVPQQENEAIW